MSPSLVLNQETSAPDGSVRSYRDHLMQGDKVEMEAALSAYAGSARSNPHKKTAALLSCRTDAWFVRHKTTGEVRVSSQTCKLRWCPFCAKRKQAYAAAQVREWITFQKYPKFLTLTVQHSDLPLVDQITDLYDQFRRLRKMKWFSERCTGGVWFFQVTFNKDSEQWHPHLHCIVTGKYLPHRRLNREWAKVTSGSFVTDVQMVKDAKNAANEVARYCARPARLSSLSADSRSEMVDAFFGKRLCGTWGTGRKISFRPVPDSSRDDWQNLGTWTYIHMTADRDSTAAAILRAYRNDEVLPFYEPVTDYTQAPAVGEPHPPPDDNYTFQRTFF
jgi:Replication protein